MNRTAQLLLAMLFSGLLLVYGIFLLRYLNDSSKCDRMMKKHNRDFRKVALVITWIHVILSGLGVLASAFSLLAGDRVTGMDLVSGAVGAVSSPSSESSLM